MHRGETGEYGAAAVASAESGRFGPAAGSQAPMLAVATNADPADPTLYRRAGMNGVVEEPIKPERLLAAMNAVLDMGETREAVA